MPRISNGVGNVQVTGAASTLRVRWPRGITDGGDSLGVAKFGEQELNGWTITAFSGGTQQTLVSAGAAAVDMKSTNVPTGYGVFYARRLSWFTELTGGPVLDGWACWSFRLTMACHNPTGAAPGDFGIVITCGNQNDVNSDGLTTHAGVIFGPTDANTLTLRARQANGGAQTVTDVVPAGLTPNFTLFNTYELQVISGSNVAGPILVGLVNGTVVTGRHLWTAAAGVLPPPNAVAGNLGYQFGFVNRSAGVTPDLFVHEALLTAAQSAADLT